MTLPPRIVVAPPGPRSRALGEELLAAECPAFETRREARAKTSGEEQHPIVYATGEGGNVVDVDGNRYVDLVAGFGALVLGHRPPAVAKALRAQEERLWLALGDVYSADVKVELVKRLAALLPEPGARVLLGSSGADAVTAALKTAKLRTGRDRVVAFEGAYHGLSYAPLAACGLAPPFRAPFAGQLGAWVDFVPYPHDEASLEACMVQVRALAPKAGAILVEPVLGRGGCVVPPSRFLPALREAADASGALLVADEVWTGMGRCGAMLASIDQGVLPDIVCVGKGLGAGLPISACIGRAEAMEAWGAHGGGAIHTGTHFGSPLACAAALAVLDAFADGALFARAREVGARFRDTLARELAPQGARVRGAGMMIGIAFEGDAPRALGVVRRLLDQGYLALTGGTAGDVVTLTPPLDLEEERLEDAARAILEALATPIAVPQG